MASNSETGIQLVARLSKKNSLSGKLEARIFPDGPEPGDIIEFYGPEGCGKTQCLLHLLANCIIPAKWRDVTLGGLDVAVMFIDTEYDMSLIRLATLLEARLNQVINTKMSQSDDDMPTLQPTPEESEEFVRTCLQKLLVVKCSSSHHLVCTLHSLDSLLCTRPEIGLVLLDSVSSFFWMDKCSGGDSVTAQKKNMEQVASLLKQMANTYKVTVIATKSALFQKRVTTKEDSRLESTVDPSSPVSKGTDSKLEHCEFLCHAWSRMVTRRFMFTANINSASGGASGGERSFSVWVDGQESSSKKTFKIGEIGLLIS